MDHLLEVIRAFRTKLNSPFFGMICLSFVAVNWQPIFLVLFTDTWVFAKFWYFNATVRYWEPIVFGLFAAAASPFIKLGGVWISRWPSRKYSNWMHDETVAREEYRKRSNAISERLETERRVAEERALVARVEVDQRVDAIANPVTRRSLRKEIASSRERPVDVINMTMLKDLVDKTITAEKAVLVIISKSGQDRVSVKSNEFGVEIWNSADRYFFSTAEYPKSNLAIYNLLNKRLVRQYPDEAKLALTPLGGAVVGMLLDNEELLKAVEKSSFGISDEDRDPRD